MASTSSQARLVARRARERRLRPQIVDDEQHGRVCVVATPWHERPVILRDTLDVDWLAAELATDTTETGRAA